jgi:hypothetical protein
MGDAEAWAEMSPSMKDVAVPTLPASSFCSGSSETPASVGSRAALQRHVEVVALGFDD